MIEIDVELGTRRYAVKVGRGIAARLPELLRFLRGRRLALVSSARVFGLHGGRIEKSLRSLGPVCRVLIPDGEARKSRNTLGAVQDAFFRAGLQRDAAVVAFGGGVVGDLAGFAAATYMRGIDLVQIPTTLLAMVDSAIGGKVGVNHPRAKNLIGTFHQPRAVIGDLAFLDTLPLRELRSGAYEMLKCGLIGDPGLFRALQRAPPGLAGWDGGELESAVASACRIKASVVAEDEREGGLRRVLNLGHTLGHALEALTRYRRFSHGEAVGWGLIGVAAIAWSRGLLPEAGWNAVAEAVDRIGPRPRISDLAPDSVLALVSRDKKVKAGWVTFVLPTRIGRVVLCDDVTRAEIRRALRLMASRERPRR